METLERRNLLAAAIWDGGGGTDLKWSTPANWVGDITPATGDDVTINDPRDIEVLYDLTDPLTITSLNASESLKLTTGELTVSGAMVMAPNARLTAQAAEFQADGATTVDNAHLYAIAGGQIKLAGVISYTSTTTSNFDRYLRADGVGSVLSLPNLASLTGARNGNDEVRVNALNGGVVELGTQVDSMVVPSGAVQFLADGGEDDLASLIDMPNLTSFQGYFDYYFATTESGFFAKNGGAIHSPKLTSISHADITLDGSGTMDTRQIVSYNGGYYGDLTLSNVVPDFSSMESLTWANVRVDGLSVPFPLLTNIDTSSWYLTNAATVTLDGVTSYTNSNTNDGDRYLRADGVGSVLSLPNLASLTGARNGNDEVRVNALNGGVVELGTQVDSMVVPSGAVQFLADGGEDDLASLIDMPNLTSFQGYFDYYFATTESGFFAKNVGTLKVGSEVSHSAVKSAFIDIGSNGTLQTTSLTAVSGVSFRGGGAITGDYENGSQISPGPGDSSLTLQGNFRQSNSGQTRIEIGGNNAGMDFDQLAVGIEATLGGTLEIVRTNGFLPTLRQEFHVLVAGSVSGSFSNVVGAAIGDGIKLQPEIRSDGVYLVAVADLGPKLIGTIPKIETRHSLNFVDVVFDEPIAADSIDVSDMVLSGPGGVITIDAVSQPTASSVRFEFADQTAPGTYTYSVGSQITDAAGNLMDQDGNGTGGEAGDVFTSSIELVVPNEPVVFTQTPSGLVTTSSTTIDLGFSVPLDVASATDANSFVLTHLGADQRVGGGDDQAFAITPTYTAASLDVSLAADDFATGLPDGHYQLRVLSGATGIRNVVGGQLDGNDDGTPGDDYVGQFQVSTSAATAELRLAAISDSGVSSSDGITNIADITFEVTVNQIGRIEFDADGNGAANETMFASQPGTYSFTTTFTQDGNHQPKIVFQPAYGSRLNRSASVTLDRTAPTFVLGETTQQAPVLSRVVQFSETVTNTDGSAAAGTLMATLTGPANQPINLRGLSGDTDTYVLTFDPLFVPGDYELAATTQIFDVAGNKIAAAPVDPFVVLADVTKPFVTEFSPLGETNQDTDRFVVTFSEPMDAATLTPSVITVQTPAGIPAITAASVAAVAGSDTQYEITLAAPISVAGEYLITIAASVADLSGNTLGTAYAAAITIDRTGSRITTATPAGTLNRVVSFVDVTFDSPIQLASFRNNDVTLTGPAGAVSIGQPTRLSGNAYRIPFTPQRANGDYQLTVGPNVLDIAGNPMDQDSDGTTGEATEDVFTHAFAISLPDLNIVDSVGLTDLGGAAITEMPFGSSLQIAWTTTNSGTLATIGANRDQVWLSSDATLSAGDVLLGAFELSGANTLATGAEYSGLLSTSIPLTNGSVAGDYFILVQTDSTGGIVEANEQNNVRAVPLSLTFPPLPDLVATEITPPSEIVPGTTTTLGWQIDNIGDEIAVGPWIERVFLANDAGGDNRQLVASFNRVGSLTAADAARIRTEQISLPQQTLNGDVYFLIEVDSGEAVFESDEQNLFASATTLNIPASLTMALGGNQVTEGGNGVRATLTRNGDVSLPLVVSLSASASDQLSLPETVTIPAGQYSRRFTISAIDEAVIDDDVTVLVSANADDYPAASGLITVVNNDQPTLTLSLPATEIVEGGSLTATITRGSAASTDIIISVLNADASQLDVVSSVTLPAGQTSVTFGITAIDDLLIERATQHSIAVSAVGHLASAGDLTILQSDVPAITLQMPQTLAEGSSGPTLLGRVTRDAVSNVAVQVELVSADPTQVVLPATVTIPAGQSFGQFQFQIGNDDLVTGDRSVDVSAGVLPSDGGAAFTESLTNTSVQILEDDGQSLSVTFASDTVAEGRGIQATIARNTTDLSQAVTVTFTSDDVGELIVPTPVTIPAGESSATVTLSGVRDGEVDGDQVVTVLATADGFLTGTGTIVVADSTLPDLIVTSLQPSSVTASTDASIDVSWTIANAGFAPATGTWTQRVFLSDDAVIGNDVLAGQYTFSGPLGKGQSYDRTAPVRLPSQSGDYWIVVQTDIADVVGEGLETNNATITASPISVEAAYTATVSTDVEMAPADTSVLLTGTATNTDTTPAAFKQVSVHVSVRGTNRIFPAITDAAGNFQLTFNPLPGEGGSYTVGAAHPGEATAQAQDTFKLVGMRAEPPQDSLRIKEGDPATSGSITIRNLADVPLTGLAVEIIDAASNLQVTSAVEGEATTLNELATLDVNYSVAALDATNRDASFAIRITSNEAPAITVPIDVTVIPLVSQLIASTERLDKGMLVGDQTSVEFTITNDGGRETGELQVLLPGGADWLTLATDSTLPSLEPGESAPVTLLLTPPSDLPLTAYNGNLIVRGSDSELSMPFSFRAVSEATGDLQVTVTDEYFYFTDEKPFVKDATVRLLDAITGELVATSEAAAAQPAAGFASLAEGEATVTVDSEGRVTFLGVPEGPYTLEVRSEDHESYRNNLRVESGNLNERQVFVSRNLVEYTWTVEEIEIEDRTRITIDAEFETNVPAPVVTIDGHIDLADLVVVGQTQQFDFKITNHGFIAAENVALEFGEHPYYEIVPLIDVIGILPAKSEITVPVIVRRIGPAAIASNELLMRNALRPEGESVDVPCVIAAVLVWTYECEGTVAKATPIVIINVSGTCSGAGGGGVYRPSGVGIGGPGSVTPISIQSEPDCADCVEDSWKLTLKENGFVNQIVQAAADLITKAPVVDEINFGLEGEASWTTCCEDNVEVGSKLVAEGSGGGDLGFSVPIVGGELDLGENVSLPFPLPGDAVLDFELKAGLFFEGLVGLRAFGKIETDCEDWTDFTGAAGVKGQGQIELKVAAGLEIDIELPSDDDFLQIEAVVEGGIRGSASGEASFDTNGDFNWEVTVGKVELYGLARFTVGQEAAELFGIEKGIELSFEISTPIYEGCTWSKSNPEPVCGSPGTETQRTATQRAASSLESADSMDDGILRNPVTGQAIERTIGNLIDLDAFAGDIDYANESELANALGESSIDLATIEQSEWTQLSRDILKTIEPQESIGGTCATVRMQITQDAVQERQAFEAGLVIDNGQSDSLTGIEFNITITNAAGEDQTDLFLVSTPTLTSIDDIDGFGVILGNESGSAVWQIVPSAEAAIGTQEYFVGGEFSYLDGVTKVSTRLAPTSILVLPQAELTLDYFLQRDVLSDDPHTADVEPAQPFTLAVQVRNDGAGAAQNLRIESAQPKIIENEKGLLIDFEITGTRVNGEEKNRSLTAQFGDVGPGELAIAEWEMESTLQGLFVEYNATFEHISGLGDERFSLIKDVQIHELIHVANASQVDGDDGLPDFLVNDLPDPQDLPDTLYLSDGSVVEVGLGSGATIDTAPVISDLRIDVTATMEEGWSYLTMDDPSLGDFVLLTVERSDGTTLPPENFWQTDRTFVGGGLRPVLEDKIHLLDFNSTGSYTFVFSNGDLVGPEVVSFAGVTPNPTTETIDVVDVTFDELLNNSTFDAADISLTKNSVPVSTSGLSAAAAGGTTYRISGLAAFTSDDAVYEVTIDASQLTDQVGNPGVGLASYRWVKGEAAPAILDLLGAPSHLTTTSTNSINVVFSKPIVPGSFGLDDVSLTRDGIEVIDAEVTIAQVAPTTYRVGNLSRLISSDADYRLVVDATGVQDDADLAGVGDATATWTLDSTAPVVVDVVDPPTNPRNIVVQRIDIDFSEPIDLTTLDVGDLTLTRDGGTENLLAGDARVTFEDRGDNRYRIGGINWVQAFLADPQIASFTLTIDGAGITDLAGNPSSGLSSTTWTIDLDNPVAPADLTLSTFTGEVTDAQVNSRFASVAGTLAETGLTVSVRDMTTNTELIRETIAGTSFDLPIEFPSAGQHRLRVRVVDPAGNVTDAFIEDLFVNETAPLVESVAGIPSGFTNQPLGDVTLLFVEPINPATLTASAMTLTRDGGVNLIDAGVTITAEAGGRSFVIGGLASVTAGEGMYDLSIELSSVTSQSGQPATGQLQFTWTTDTGAPTSQVSSLPTSQDLPNFVIGISGSDPAITSSIDGSAIVAYDLFVSENDGDYTLHESLPADAASTTFIGQENSSYQFYSVARDAAGNAEAAPEIADAETTVARLGPGVDATGIQGVITSRSYVDRIEIEFAGRTNLDDLIADSLITGAFKLTHLGVNANTDTPAEIATSTDQFQYSFDPDSNTGLLTWSLDSFADTRASLADGIYVVELDSSLVTDVAGFALDGDGDGFGGGTYRFEFHRLAGDADGNGAVGPTDMGIVLDSIGATPGSDRWNENIDLDRDGRITVRDRVLIARALNNKIVPATPGVAPVDTLARFDTSIDGEVTALDALLVINRIAVNNSSAMGEAAGQADSEPHRHLDVSGDGLVSALDALQIINQLSRSLSTVSVAEAGRNLAGSLADSAMAETIDYASVIQWMGEEDDDKQHSDTLDVLAYDLATRSLS
ncbi:hypothetical protein Poly51_44740 [Rubripirellula tenax]|uniref:Uncharacterized protein n=1 Tax=Rubripirellula tenax TaxID=2528015 RepID=A0A5C6EJA4_9BACT|nr:CARDB domain-containing protein [Rubripirellula tenax]TWU48574.1 hypothetical protein Poly51_44740 [Rubripirellula tenax]